MEAPNSKLEPKAETPAEIPSHLRNSNPYTKKKGSNLLTDITTFLRQPSQFDTAEVFVPDTWDGWPNGNLDLDLTKQQFSATKDLVTHWACARRNVKGNREATSWEKGVRQRRDCLGIFQCTNPNCNVVVRPLTRTALERSMQLKNPCRLCGSDLDHLTCNAKAVVYFWKDGVHYTHHGHHEHKRLPRKLHLTATEEDIFRNTIAANPSTTPLSLVTGGLGNDSVSNISAILANTDRVQYERQKAKKKLNISAGDDFLASLESFQADHGQYIKVQQISGQRTIISLQSPRMKTLPLEDWTSLP